MGTHLAVGTLHGAMVVWDIRHKPTPSVPWFQVGGMQPLPGQPLPLPSCPRS
jgi:hypothetical protein